MSLPRLIFLYPHLFKPTYQQEAVFTLRRVRKGQNVTHAAAFSTKGQQKQETYAQRYGTAKEPKLPKTGSQRPPKMSSEKSLAGEIEQEVKTPAEEEETPETNEERKAEALPEIQEQTTENRPEKATVEIKQEPDAMDDRSKATEAALEDPTQRVKNLDKSTFSARPPNPPDPSAPSKESLPAKPLAEVLEMPAPMVEKPEEHKLPHLQTPPYVHHFDTYTLVNNLEHGGFTDEQSVSVMKAVRSLLAVNLDVAKESLVSKSDVENETYLFRAACSELRTEILNLRRSTTAKQSTQLTHLQHANDILSQRTTAELASLRDELKGMLNDRRMDTRASSQMLDSQISELNYRISAHLGSDAKSEVEGLRWVLTRRAAMAIAFMAMLILGSLRMGSWKKQSGAVDTGTMANGRAQAGGGKTERAAHGGSIGEAKRLRKEEDVGYVSLG